MRSMEDELLGQEVSHTADTAEDLKRWQNFGEDHSLPRRGLRPGSVQHQLVVKRRLG